MLEGREVLLGSHVSLLQNAKLLDRNVVAVLRGQSVSLLAQLLLGCLGLSQKLLSRGWDLTIIQLLLVLVGWLVLPLKLLEDVHQGMVGCLVKLLLGFHPTLVLDTLRDPGSHLAQTVVLDAIITIFVQDLALRKGRVELLLIVVEKLPDEDPLRVAVLLR